MMSNERYFVYVISSEADYCRSGPTKIGVSKNPRSRLASLQSAHPRKLKLVHVFSVPDKDIALYLERSVLDAEKKHRLNGEWLDTSAIRTIQVVGLAISITLLSAWATPEKLKEIKRRSHSDSVPGENIVPNFGNIPELVAA